jgi:uncharacterized protein YidB (DUF937 family)
MGLFDQITSMVGGNLQGGSGQGGLLEQAINLINNPAVGGLSGLINKFEMGDLGEIISSWIGTGENLPVSGDQMIRALGSDKIKEIAAGLGISNAEAANGLASVLPSLIDKLTPQGKLPDGNSIEQALGELTKQFLNRS